MPKLKWDTFSKSKEYEIWQDLDRVCEAYNITEDTYFNLTDLGGLWWEPLLDRIVKLAVCLKCNKKLKLIKMDWIRPTMITGADSNGIIRNDLREDKVDKGAVSDATQIRYSFKGLINAIRDIQGIDDKTFKEKYKKLKKELKYFMKLVANFVKTGFRPLHEYIKLLLFPLRELRRAGYRLFSLEKAEAHFHDLTIFQDKKEVRQLENSITDFFKWEQFKMKRDCDREMLKEYLAKPIDQNLFVYTFSTALRLPDKPADFNPNETQVFKKDQHSSRESTERGRRLRTSKVNQEEKQRLAEMKARHNLIYPNIEDLKQPEPTRFRKEAYQSQFENGIKLMIEYLMPRLKKEFPFYIEAHKIFVNLNCIPDGRKEYQTEFYLGKLFLSIEKLKTKCYEMKLNGISRVKIPIYENKEIIDVLKEIFDLHVIIDRIMGSYLLHEQYMFFFKKIKFITDSTLKEEIKTIKNKDFMEERIPKYIFFESLCHSVEVVEKMILEYHERGEKFKNEDSFQIIKHSLDDCNNSTMIDCFEIADIYKKFLTPEIEKYKEDYYAEIKKYGRYWLMEGFFPKEDKDLWIEAIEQLRNINELVREDIRDNILNPYKAPSPEEQEKEKGESKRKLSSTQGLYEFVKKPTKKGSKAGFKTQKSRISRKRTQRNKNDVSILDESFEIQQKKIPKKLDGLRPPNVWNFPIHRIQKIKAEKYAKENDGDVLPADIRNVDPTKSYVNGAVQKFMALFDKIYANAMKYCKDVEGDSWNYVFEKILRVLDIHYYPFELAKDKEKQGEEEKKEEEDEYGGINIKKEVEKAEKEDEMRETQINTNANTNPNNNK